MSKHTIANTVNTIVGLAETNYTRVTALMQKRPETFIQGLGLIKISVYVSLIPSVLKTCILAVLKGIL